MVHLIRNSDEFGYCNSLYIDFLVCSISDRKVGNDNDLCCLVLECSSVIAHSSLSSLENSLQKTIRQQNPLPRPR